MYTIDTQHFGKQSHIRIIALINYVQNLELQVQTIIHNSKHTAYLVKLQFEELLQDVVYYQG